MSRSRMARAVRPTKDVLTSPSSLRLTVTFLPSEIHVLIHTETL